MKNLKISDPRTNRKKNKRESNQKLTFFAAFTSNGEKRK